MNRPLNIGPDTVTAEARALYINGDFRTLLA
jgi:hypothetical protein